MSFLRPSILIGPLIALATLGALFTIGELTARLLLPAQQSVQIENVHPVQAYARERQQVEGTRNIDSVFEWGHQGIRLRPSINAVIRNHVLSHEDIKIDVNSLGLRYDELGPKAPGEFRVLVLGDSITIGDYVQQNETYPAILESLATKAGKSVRFINGGIPGASFSSEIYRYLEIRDAVQPDLVLVGMYLNDSVDSKIFIAQGLPRIVATSALLTWVFNRLDFLKSRFWKTQVLPTSIDENWKEDFRAGRDLHSGDMFNSAEAVDFEVYNAAMDFGLAWNEKTWSEILEPQLFALRQAAKSVGTEVAVFLFPVHFQVLSNVEDFRPQKYFMKMCRNAGVSCFDTLPGLRAEWHSKQQNLYYDHCHYRPYGNQVVANLVFDWLNSQGLIGAKH